MDALSGLVVDKSRGLLAPLLIAALLVAAVLSAPKIEIMIDPVYGLEQIKADSITRTNSDLCWTRISQKLRSPPVENFDVFLDRVNNKGVFVRSFPEVYDPENGESVTTDKSPPPGWRRPLRCVALHNIPIWQTVRLTQTVHFQGFLGLWDLPLRLPDVVSFGKARNKDDITLP